MRVIRRVFPAVLAVGAVAVVIVLSRALVGGRPLPLELAAPPSSTRTAVQAPIFPVHVPKPAQRAPAPARPAQPQRVRLVPSPQLASQTIVHHAAPRASRPAPARSTGRPRPAAPAPAPTPAPVPAPAPAPAPAPQPAPAPTPAPAAPAQPGVRVLAAQTETPPVTAPVVAAQPDDQGDGDHHRSSDDGENGDHGDHPGDGHDGQGDQHGDGHDGHGDRSDD